MLMKPEVSAGCHQTLSLVGGVWGRDYLVMDIVLLAKNAPGSAQIEDKLRLLLGST